VKRSVALAIGFRGAGRAILQAVDPGWVFTEANETSEAVALLRNKRFSAIFVDAQAPGFSPSDFDQLRIAAPQTPKALVGHSTQAPLLEMLAASAQFSFLSAMQLDGHRVTGRVGDRQFEHELLDLSNRGVSFSVQPGALLDSFLPGASVQGLQIVGTDGRRLLGLVQATVRHCKAEGSPSGPLVRVGLSFDAHVPAKAPHVRTVTESLPIIASLRKATRAHATFTLALPDAEAGFRFPDAEVVLDPLPTLCLSGPIPAGFRAHDVVRLTFSHHGQSYSGLTSIISVEEGIRLAVPRTMRVHHRRGSNRHRPTASRSYEVRLRSPLTKREHVFQVHDINVTGLSVIIDRNDDLLPPGLMVDPLEIMLPDGGPPVLAQGIVRALTPLARQPDDDEGSPARCGIEFMPLAESEHTRLSQCLLGDGFPHVEAAGPQDFEEVWQFLREAGFTFHLYGDQTSRSVETVRSGFGHLLGPARPLAVSLVFRDAEKIRGHISALHLYSKTLMLTHLAALQGKAAPVDRISRALCMGVIEYAEQQPSVEFVKLNWNRDSPWPNRMFGWSGRAIHHDGLSDAREFAVMVRRNDLLIRAAEDVQVRPSADADLKHIERYLVETASMVRLQSEDLSLATLRLSQVDERYQQFGLFRRRHIRTAWLDGAPAGFAFLERTTAGVQLAEATNAFDVSVFPAVPAEDQPRVRAALISDAIAFYTQEGLSHSVSMTEDAGNPAFLDAGFRCVSVSRSWTWHRSQFRSWTDVWDQLFVRGREMFGARMGQ
jgi:hypothetical protein